jgi:HlyD family secretion protein
VRIAGPGIPVAVIRELRVEDGEFVTEGEILAVLDGFVLRKAEVELLAAELDYEEAELHRKNRLYEEDVIEAATQDAQATRTRVARARLQGARAELDRYRVRAPFAGRIMRIHAHPGERVGEEGILEMGATHRMVAIAEVYETDIPRVQLGQRATVTSPVFSHPVTGRVSHIWPLVAKQDALGTDPAARKDARAVEVEIQLDESGSVASLSFLQVTVEIHPEAVEPSTS